MGYSLGYDVGIGSYGARRGGVAMKRDECTFSVCEEDEEEAEAEEEGKGGAKGGWSSERRRDGTEMEMD